MEVKADSSCHSQNNGILNHLNIHDDGGEKIYKIYRNLLNLLKSTENYIRILTQVDLNDILMGNL